MVSRESATAGLCRSQPNLTVQIDENHSAMVKLTQGDNRLDILASKLREVCEPRTTFTTELEATDQTSSSAKTGSAGPDDFAWNDLRT
jgi:hypothetical protein